MTIGTRTRFFAVLFILSAILPGCLLVSTTEHRIKVNDDGSGEAVLRMIDIRSDGSSDSSVAVDFGLMMAAFDSEGVRQFEAEGRHITGKQFIVRNDTLVAEVTYAFDDLYAIEGLHVTKDALYVIVGEDREILKTNGKTSSAKHNATRISWSRDARRLLYTIREKSFPKSTSLAGMYLRQMR